MGTILRDGLLAGTTVVCASPGPNPGFDAIAAGLHDLGAEVHRPTVDPDGDEPDAVPGGHVVVWDGAWAACEESGGGTRWALDGAWLAVRPAAREMIERGEGGKIVLLAPPPGGTDAAAARAGLENLARVTSIEWARFQITITAIHPGADSEPAAIADLIAYIASPAGDYASGCVFALR